MDMSLQISMGKQGNYVVINIVCTIHLQHHTYDTYYIIHIELEISEENPKDKHTQEKTMGIEWSMIVGLHIPTISHLMSSHCCKESCSEMFPNFSKFIVTS